ncbi:MAG: CoA pyrophosphatase [Bacteroidetes bacterium]|nr:CoA pyrophosphatase [Bacteroidota bacterium]
MKKSELTLEEIARKLQTHQALEITQVPVGFREAAVLLPLVEVDGHVHVLLTRRTLEVKTHKGQVAFPGGMRDVEDSSLEITALRETQEEIEVLAGDVSILGHLNDRLTISDFLVRPFVGIIKSLPPEILNLKNHEIARVFTVPLEWLANPDHVRIELWERQKFIRNMHFWHFGEEIIWGMSAEVVAELIEVLYGKERFEQVPLSPTTMDEFLAVLNSKS